MGVLLTSLFSLIYQVLAKNKAYLFFLHSAKKNLVLYFFLFLAFLFCFILNFRSFRTLLSAQIQATLI